MAAVGSKRQTSLAASLLDPIPANRLFGLRVLAAEDGHAEVGMDVSNEASNVIGSLHSSGLVALVDAAGLAALISVAASDSEFDGVVPLGSVAHLDFLAPARGRLTAHCRVGQTDRHALRRLLSRRTDRATAETEAEVRDEDGTVVCRGTFVWKIRRVAAA